MVPQSDPKATQMDMGGPLKTYGIYCVDATWGHFGRDRKSFFFSFCFLSWRLRFFFFFFSLFVTFVDFGAKMVPKMGRQGGSQSHFVYFSGTVAAPNCTCF